MNLHPYTVLRAACILIAGIAILAIGVQPIFIGLLVERLALSLAQQSAVMSAEMCGSILGTLACMPLMRRCSVRRVALVAALALLGGNLLTSQVERLESLVALRLVCGVGSGVLYAYAIYGLGCLRNPDRSYGVLLFLQTGLFALVAAMLPMIAGRLGFGWAIGYLAAWFIPVCLACFCLPRAALGPTLEGAALQGERLTLAGVLSLIGMVLLQLSIYSLWGFVEGVGRDAGVTAVDIGGALSIGLLGGLPGAALPSLLGERLGRAPMILCGSLLVLLAILMLATRIHSAVDLCLAVFLMNVGWNLALSYYMSSIVSHDPTGKLTRLIGAVQVISGAAAPTLLMLFMGAGGRQTIFLLSAGAIVLGCLAVLLMAMTCRGGKPAFRLARSR